MTDIKRAPTTVILPPGQEHLARRVAEVLRAEGLRGALTIQSTDGRELLKTRRIVTVPPPSSGDRGR